jgi:Neutral/alkaline non-lysosomal ceramidase, N-terminal
MIFSAGAAKQEITPVVGVGLSGFIARLEPSNGIGDPLHVRAVVLSDGTRLAAIVQADLLGFSRWHVTAVREFASSQLGISRNRVLLSATHTHSGPGVVRVRGCEVASAAYQWEVVNKINMALTQAKANLLPAKLGLTSVPYTLGFNRREETSNGVILGLAPEKPRPERLEVVCIRNRAQEILLYSHACHPYMLGGESLLISGDFPSFASQELEAGGQRFGLFLNGCAGNIRPMGAFEGLDKASSEGKRLASAVEDACLHLPSTDSDLTLDALNGQAHLPFAPLPDEGEIAEILGQQERVVRPDERVNPEVGKKIQAAVGDWASLMTEIVRLKAPMDPAFCEVQTLRIGAFALVGISGEPFFEIGQTISATSPFEVTWPLGYTNAYCGYIPTRKEYPGGGYEVNDSWKYVGQWKIDDSGEDRVVEAARHELSALGERTS